MTIQQRGMISLNKAAHNLMSSGETVELLYDRDRNVVALPNHAGSTEASTDDAPLLRQPTVTPTTTDTIPSY